MSKLNDLIKELCPNGVEYVKLEELVDYIQPAKYIVKNTNYDIKYDVPVLTAGQTFILGYTNEKDGIYYASADNPVVIFDDFTTSNHWVDFNFKVKSSAMKILISKTDNLFKYIYYCISNIDYVPKEHSRQWIQVYSQFQIPLPPLKVQEEIVRILDKFGELEAELEAELETRKNQYEFWRGKLLNQKNEVKKLSEVSDVIDSLHATPQYVENGYPMIRVADVKGGIVNTTGALRVDVETYNKFVSKYKPKKGDIIISRVGSFGNLCIVGDEDMCLGQNTSIIHPRINDKYLYYYLSSDIVQDWIKNNVNGSGYKSLSLANINEIPIAVPSIQEQQKVANILDQFDKLINDISEGLPAEIELRRQQYEYYRNKLLSFKEIQN